MRTRHRGQKIVQQKCYLHASASGAQLDGCPSEKKCTISQTLARIKDVSGWQHCLCPTQQGPLLTHSVIVKQAFLTIAFKLGNISCIKFQILLTISQYAPSPSRGLYSPTHLDAPDYTMLIPQLYPRQLCSPIPAQTPKEVYRGHSCITGSLGDSSSMWLRERCL